MTTTIEDNFRFDSRIRQRMLKKGNVSADEMQQRLDALPDLEGETEALDLEQPGLAPLEPAEEGAEQ